MGRPTKRGPNTPRKVPAEVLMKRKAKTAHRRAKRRAKMH